MINKNSSHIFVITLSKTKYCCQYRTRNLLIQRFTQFLLFGRLNATEFWTKAEFWLQSMSVPTNVSLLISAWKNLVEIEFPKLLIILSLFELSIWKTNKDNMIKSFGNSISTRFFQAEMRRETLVGTDIDCSQNSAFVQNSVALSRPKSKNCVNRWISKFLVRYWQQYLVLLKVITNICEEFLLIIVLIL